MSTEDDPKHEHPDLVELKQAKTPFEAEVIAGVLQDAGIKAYVEGRQLTDEFALSQQLMNLQGVSIKVGRADLDSARDALAAAKRAGRHMDELDEGKGGEKA